MKKLLQGSLLILCSIGLFGCPYESEVPISKPSIPVNKTMLGKWSSKDEVYNTYTVTQASPTEYNIVQVNSVGDTKHFKGFLSQVKGNMFMNVYSDSTKAYFLYKVVIDAADKFTLIPFSDEIPQKFTSSIELFDFVGKNMNLRSMYKIEDKADFQLESAAAASYN